MEVVAVCPETAAGLPVPRPPAEHRDGRVVFADGGDATEAFERGSAACLEEVLAAGVFDSLSVAGLSTEIFRV